MSPGTHQRIKAAVVLLAILAVIAFVIAYATGCSGGSGGGPFGWLDSLFGTHQEDPHHPAPPTPESTLSWLPGLGFLTTAAGIAMVAISRGGSGVGWTLIGLGLTIPLALWLVHTFIVPTLIVLAALTVGAVIMKIMGIDVDLRGARSWLGSLHTRLHSHSASSADPSSDTRCSPES